MTATSSPPKSEPLDIDRDTILRMLEDAYRNHNQAFQKGDEGRAMWWDGGIRHLQWILEYAGQ